MIAAYTPEQLRAFAADIAECFNRGEIRAPVHLDGGNERQLIDVFRTVKETDWVCGSWRMMSKCLLKGVPAERLRADVIAGRSISLCYPEYRIISSAIVGGILPIALGIAWAIKRVGGSERVHCFMGDMTRLGGIAHECINYSAWNDLPVRWIIENNGKSVCTETALAWGGQFRGEIRLNNLVSYEYELPYPHAGAGKRVEF